MTNNVEQPTIYGMNTKEYHANTLYRLIKNHENSNKSIMIVCIGTDKVLGDSLGPLVGTLLSERESIAKKCTIYGTLSKPIHGVNFQEFNSNLEKEGKLILAVDARVTNCEEDIGDIEIGNGCVRPGAGIGRQIGEIGDIAIKGTVELDEEPWMRLNRVSLNLVLEMARKIEYAVAEALERIFKEQEELKWQ